MSGREQEEDPADNDFTGIYPILRNMIDAEKPAGMPDALRNDFRDGLTAHHKGGSYARCAGMNCVTRTQWLSWAGSAEWPTCEAGAVSSRSYVWGAFLDGTVDTSYNGVSTPADAAFLAVRAEPLREQLNAALADLGRLLPAEGDSDDDPGRAACGQDGYFNAADLAANLGGITVNVSATDDSGVTNLVCTDNGNPVAVGNQAGSNPRIGSFKLTSDGTHNVECEATDGMTPSNTGASADSSNTVTVKIDGTPPTVTCQAPPPVFVLQRSGRLGLGDGHRRDLGAARLTDQRPGGRHLRGGADDRAHRQGQGTEHDDEGVRVHRRVQVPRLPASRSRPSTARPAR